MAKKKINRAQAQALLPEVSKFNGLAKALIRLLDGKIDQKDRHLNNIRLMVNKTIKIDRGSNINITTVDINRTIVKKRGGYSYNKAMDWENQLKQKKRGIVL